ncbi:hypothetical protein ACFONL_00980 [Camelimonas fluminis]|uniref:Uncharacterized protein n=1 Tax=Camelimonas fluminis TaxID=1576911 RepID=A0ABV7UBE8_9HYPH
MSSVRFAGRCDCSTILMISSFSEAGYASPFLDAFPHLGGGVLAEGEKQDFVRLADAAFYEIGGLGNDDAGLA